MTKTPLVDGLELQEIYDTFVKALTGPGIPKHMRELARWVFVRMGAMEAAEKFCDFRTFGEWMIGSDRPVFLQQLPRVRRPEDRLALAEQHRRWAGWLETNGDRSAIALSGQRRAGNLRVGFISSGFDQIVGRFCAPLFDHKPDNMDLYVYATGEAKPEGRSEGIADTVRFQRLAVKPALDAARAIAQDDLDLLIELDGLTGEHCLDIMAYRPARLQASWLGYPHSTGLSAIDHIIVDPHLDNPHLLERPLVLPSSWIGLPSSNFHDGHVIVPSLPEERSGHLTFGTQNNPYKFTVDSIRTWARIVSACPGSKFMFVRPEANAPSFRRGMIKRFGAEGVGEDRLAFDSTSRGHMALYNEIDISLDTFPLTGGTTTAEALWMGVPVVSLVGECMFERLSYSLLVNAGLPELAVETVEEYEAAAIALAKAPARRADMRSTLRAALKAGPLGRPDLFARDFFEAVGSAIRSGAGRA